MQRPEALLTLAALLAGCTFDQLGQSPGAGSSAPTDAERVFAATAGSANTAVLLGIWEGPTQVEQTLSSTPRFEFRESFVVAAARCVKDGKEPVVVGGRGAASISPGIIEIKQAISDSEQIDERTSCGVSAAPGVLTECDPLVPTTQRTTCFDLSGGQLTLFQAGSAVPFQKVAD
jgi:hypothetical protein